LASPGVVGARPSNSSDDKRWSTDFKVSTEIAGGGEAAALCGGDCGAAQAAAARQRNGKARYFMVKAPWNANASLLAPGPSLGKAAA
jgi:hypothetical protein